MYRFVLALVTMISVGIGNTSAVAADTFQTRTIQDQWVAVEAGSVNAYFMAHEAPRGIEVSMLFRGIDDLDLQSRVTLVDGQEHRIAFEADGGVSEQVAFMFKRAGEAVTVMAATADGVGNASLAQSVDVLDERLR